MAKTKVDEWDTVPANNAEIDGISILGTAPASNMDNALRELMAQIRATPLRQGAEDMRTALGAQASWRTLADAIADAPALNPEFYSISYRDTNYRAGSGGVYRKQASEPSHDLKFQNANSIWYALDGATVTTAQAGAVIDGATDDTAAINRAVAFAKTKTIAHFILSPGVHATASAVVIDLPSYSQVEFQGRIVSSVTSGIAVTVGRSDPTFGLKFSGLDVRSSGTYPYAASAIGLQLLNLVGTIGNCAWTRGFGQGLNCHGVNANGGFSYNTITLGIHDDSLINLYLTKAGSGYNNENMFIAGSFNHSSAWPAGTASVNIEISDASMTNNVFIKPSLEDGQIGSLSRAMNISGTGNLVFWPRMENPVDQSGYKIVLSASSANNTIELGYVADDGNIADSGTGNSYSSIEGVHYNKATPVSATKSTLTLKSSTSTSANLLRGLNVSGTQTFALTGSGNITNSGTITSGGLIIAPDLYAGAPTGYVYSYLSTDHGRTDYRKTNTGTVTGVSFLNSSAISVGGLTYSDTATALVTSSDYRLPWKQGATEIIASGEFIDRLKVYNFPLGGTAGFLAHELQPVSPVSVTGEKDAVNADGEPEYQAVNYSSPELIANMVAELQSLRLRVGGLEERAAVKGSFDENDA